VRKPRSFGAEGWLKVDLPVDDAPEDAVWFRRVRNIVTTEHRNGDNAAPSELVPLHSSLYVGDRADAKNMEQLRRLGITHVLNCATAAETGTGPGFYAERSRSASPLSYLELGAADSDIANCIAPHLAQASAFIDSALRAGGGVLVHCVAGINRSPAICVAYMVQRLRVPLLEATHRVWRARPATRVLRNEKFCRELVTLAREEGMLEPPAMISAPVMSTTRTRGNFPGL